MKTKSLIILALLLVLFAGIGAGIAVMLEATPTAAGGVCVGAGIMFLLLTAAYDSGRTY